MTGFESRIQLFLKFYASDLFGVGSRINIEEDFIYPKAENLAKDALGQSVLEIIKKKEELCQK